MLQVLLPVVVAGLSAIALLSRALRRAAKSRQDRGYHQLPTHRDTIGVGIDDGDTEDDDEFAEHLSLRHTLSRTTLDHHIELDKPRAERFAVIIEIFCLVGVVATQVAVFTSVPGARDWPTLVPVATWTYTLVLAAIRLACSAAEDSDFSYLWDHTALIYLFNFLFLAIPFHSALVHPVSPLSEVLEIARFALVGVLCIITISVRKGNSVVAQEIVGDLEPSREPVASLLSLASFSWVDGIVWKGYWKPLTLNDVWNLRNDDVAVSVLACFRQTR